MVVVWWSMMEEGSMGGVLRGQPSEDGHVIISVRLKYKSETSIKLDWSKLRAPQ